MRRECSGEQFELEGFGRRHVLAASEVCAKTLDGVGLLLRHVDRVIGLIERVEIPAVYQRARAWPEAF